MLNLEIVDKFIPLVGVIIGGLITYLTQAHIYNRNLKKEKNTERIQRATEKLNIYNEVLEVDGTFSIEQLGGRYGIDFNLGAYKSKIRPLIYEKYHLLNKEMAKKVREMDKIIGSINFSGDDSKSEHDNLINLYCELIDLIELEVENLRDKYFI